MTMAGMTIVDESSDVGQQRKAALRCIREPSFFINNFCSIDDEDEGIIPFKLYPGQEELIKMYQAHQFVVALKSRQIGISWLTAAWSLWLCIFHTNKNVMVISYNEDVANAFVTKAQFLYDNLPVWLKPNVYKRNDSMLHLARFEYRNEIRTLAGRDSKIQGFPRTERTGRFIRASAIIFDEAAHIPEMQPLMTSALGSVATSGGKVFMVSTAAGMGNNFYKVCSEAGVQGKQYRIFKKWFGGWRTDPRRDEEWYAIQAELFGDDVKQEFPGTEDEAFLASGTCFFDAERVASELKQLEENPKKAYRGDIVYDPTIKDLKIPKLLESSDGETVIWAKPKKDGNYVIGCDVAEGMEKGDNSVFYVMDTDTGEFVAEYCSKISPDALALKLRDAGIYYNNAFVGVEANNQGSTTLRFLTDMDFCNYGNIYFREVQDELMSFSTRKLGWYTSSSTRRNMLNLYNYYYKEEKIKVYSPDLLGEMLRFVRDPQGRPAARGYDLDDRVMAAAVTAQMAQAQPNMDEFIDAETLVEMKRRKALDTIRQKMVENQPHYIISVPEDEEELSGFAL
jgi:hypothetical protein